jgi:ankyrin repeat protein
LLKIDQVIHLTPAARIVTVLACCSVLLLPVASSAGAEIPQSASRTDLSAAILEAASSGDIDRVELLLEADASLLHVRDGDGLTPLHHAVISGHTELAERLLDRGADLMALDADDRTPLHHAASHGDAASVALLLARGAEVMARDFRGRTPLFIAANWGGSVEVVELLIAAGADVNDVTELGERILFSTLFYGDPEIIRVLLDAGAKLPDDDESIVRSIYLAASNGFEEVFEMAVAEAESREIPWWESVPMHAAARGGSVRIGETLLAHDLPADERDLYGITPLHIAAEQGHLAFARLLVQNGADVETASAMGLTAVQIAQENGRADVVAWLQEMGASMEPPVFPRLEGPWLGQPQPAEGPVRFAPGIVSGHGFDSEHSPAAFSPDGKEVYWTQKFRGPVLVSQLSESGWTRPRPAEFNTEHGEGEPIFSPDGQRLYFLSMRPLAPGSEPGDEHIWYVERAGEGWSEPRPVEAVVNAYQHHWLISVSEAGTLYFASVHEGGFGGHDIYRSRQVNGVHQAPENLGPTINGDGSDHTPFIAPDETYILFSSTGHGTRDGGFHLFISYRGPDGEWLPPLVLDELIAPVDNPLCPIVTADGQFLFFIGAGDIWWTSAEFIERMRPPSVSD